LLFRCWNGWQWQRRSGVGGGGTRWRPAPDVWGCGLEQRSGTSLMRYRCAVSLNLYRRDRTSKSIDVNCGKTLFTFSAGIGGFRWCVAPRFGVVIGPFHFTPTHRIDHLLARLEEWWTNEDDFVQVCLQKTLLQFSSHS
jgi:hypothetical protein